MATDKLIRRVPVLMLRQRGAALLALAPGRWLALASAGLCAITLGCNQPPAAASPEAPAASPEAPAANPDAPAANPDAPAASPGAPALRSVAEALSHYREAYEVGWLTASGEVAYSRVTGVSAEPNGSVRIQLAEPSLLWGTTEPRAFTGQWEDASGKGDLWLQFVPDYTSAAGWWNDGGATPKRDLWLRLTR